MTNFDFLLATPAFESFADTAVAAERIYPIDPSASVVNCRRAMEYAVKWMYSVDSSLVMPWDDKLVSLMNTNEFRDIVDSDILRRMDFIRRIGNIAAHEGKKITKDQALLCLQHLYSFMDFVAYCYGDQYTEGKYNPALLVEQPPVAPAPSPEKDIQIEQLKKENAALRDELTARREEQQQTYVPKPLDISEYKTRKAYIDYMLMDAGWAEGNDWLNEVELQGMPNATGVGYADYVLYGSDGRVLAVIEAKRTCVDVSKGRQQAKLYADLIEAKQGRRPVVFLTNGFETRIIDNQYPERRVSTIYSKRDLEKWFNLLSMRTSLAHIVVDKKIAGRYYQEQAIRAVCESFDTGNRRKALLVMATGSGKTRTVIALSKVLLDQGWVKNILFLADRNSLVTQAKRSFVNLLPDLSVVNLCEDKNNYGAHCVFSTYQTMYNCIDAIQDEQGKLFTCGHFDLIICDEAHRSIYNKYKDIFDYFDAPLVGLTATPKDDIDKNTYGIFELQSGVPTYGYELAEAVRDGFLVDFISVESKLKFLEQGIVYDELSDEDRQAYEATFTDENGELPESISSSALNEWIFNEDTIREVLNILMTHGLKVDYGNRIGKTIIFAKSHTHAEKILEVFGKECRAMKNQYFADVGDYGKYGLLRFLATRGISIAVNWYLTPDDPSSNDGKFRSYLKKESNSLYDPELFNALREIKDIQGFQVRSIIPIREGEYPHFRSKELVHPHHHDCDGGKRKYVNLRKRDVGYEARLRTGEDRLALFTLPWVSERGGWAGSEATIIRVQRNNKRRNYLQGKKELKYDYIDSVICRNVH